MNRPNQHEDSTEDFKDSVRLLKHLWTLVWRQAAPPARAAIVFYFLAGALFVMVDFAFVSQVIFGEGLANVDPALYAQIIPALFIAQIVETVWMIRSFEEPVDDTETDRAEVRIDDRFTMALFAFSVGLVAVSGELLAILAVSSSKSELVHQISDVILPLTIEIQMMYLLIGLFVRGMSASFSRVTAEPEKPH